MTDNNLRDWINDRLAGVEPAASEGNDEVSDKEAEAFYGALSAADRERALVDAEEESDEAEDDEESGPIDVPTSGAELVQMAYEREQELLASGWESVDDFLVLAASDARWWMEAADAMGWPPEARPGSRDLPPHLSMAVIAAGVPGAKLRPNHSLHAPIGGSKKRLW